VLVPSSCEPVFRSGTKIGSYELVRPIASGGMGTVFEAKHSALGRRVALKVLHTRPAGATDAAREVARFLREGRAAVQVRHPNVIDVFDVGTHQGMPYLVMELVDGLTLRERMMQDGRMELPDVLDIMLPVLHAVAELHAAGVVHRDLKPANILLARGATGVVPKVADFGLSRSYDDEPLTRSDTVMGTVEYMAPEQMRGNRNVTESSDQYALGVILYEAATGQRPFVGESAYDLMHAVVTADLVSPSLRNQRLPAAFDGVLARALSREPADRFSCVDDLAEALLPFASEERRRGWAEGASSPRTAPLSNEGCRSLQGAAPVHPMARRLAVGAIAALVLAMAVGWFIQVTRQDAVPVARPSVASESLLRKPKTLVVDQMDERASEESVAAERSDVQRSVTTAARSHGPAPRSILRDARSTTEPAGGRNGAPILDAD
jgi:serine/threonine protein kinase